jgi:hypothetical protein
MMKFEAGSHLGVIIQNTFSSPYSSSLLRRHSAGNAMT